MDYYYSRKLKDSFTNCIERIKKSLKEEGFGVLTSIDVRSTLKEKLDVDFPNYMILGACNPKYSYKALQTEDKVGAMLPCNVIVQEKSEGEIEVSAVDPVASMQAIENKDLLKIASQIREKLITAVDKM